MQNDHISSSFNEDMEELNSYLAELGGLAQTQFSASIDGIATQDVPALRALIEKDSALDDLEAQIHTKAFEVIAMRGPAATDLRRVLVSLKMATSLERIGDFAKNIAARTICISEMGNERIPGVNIGRMAELVNSLLLDALGLINKPSSQNAVKIWGRDVEVDHLYGTFNQEVLASMSRNAEMVPTGSHLLFIAKNIERVGDYTTAIAEQVYFLVEGVMLDDERPKADREIAFHKM